MKDLQLWIENAERLAYRAHAGQTRSDGSPYINHPQRVADRVADRLKPIAWLHDVIEDTNVSLNDLYKYGFPEYVIEAVSLLTHSKGQPNIEYWSAIAKNPDAAAVKIADINDNMGDAPSERQKEKYAKALTLFRKLGYNA